MFCLIAALHVIVFKQDDKLARCKYLKEISHKQIIPSVNKIIGNTRKDILVDGGIHLPNE